MQLTRRLAVAWLRGTLVLMAIYLLMVLVDEFLFEVNIAIAWFHVPVLTTLGFVLQLSFVLLLNRRRSWP